MSGNDYELLSAYIDEALSPAERAELESRLQAEPRLQQELNRLRQTVMLLRDLPTLKAPRDFTLSASLIRRPLPFPLTATFSVLSTAAAILLFMFGGYILLQANNLQRDEAATMLQVAAPQNQVAAVPTISRDSAQTGSDLAFPTASPAPTIVPATDGRTQSNIPAPLMQPTTDALPGTTLSNEAMRLTATALDSLLARAAESELEESNTVPAEQPDAGGGGVNSEFFATNSATTADDQAETLDFADTDGESAAGLDEGAFEQGGDDVAGSIVADATAAAFAPVPQPDGPNFRLAPPPVADNATEPESVGQSAAQEPDLIVTATDTTASEAQDAEDRTITTEPTQLEAAPATNSRARSFDNDTLSLLLLFGGGVLLGVAIITTVVRRRRLAS